MASGGDYETFLQMLTTQMQNQNPLNPMEASDFAVQLATFSGVEQQVQTNRLLESLSTGQEMRDLANWVGMSARTAKGAHFHGSPITVATPTAESAERVELIVRDSAERTVSRMDVPLGDSSVTWSGLTDDGSAMPHGHYTFELTVHPEDGSPTRAPAEVYTRVVEAQRSEQGPMLVLEGGTRVAPGEITALREPG